MFMKIFLKSIPYFAAAITGLIFYFLASFLGTKFYDLFINISAAFFSLPLLYFFYETAKSFSHKKLNKEISDYAKMQVDRELLSILNQLQKIVFTLEEKDFSNKEINKFLANSRGEIENKLQNNIYIGFQIFKHWGISEKGLNDLLNNLFILDKMEDEQIISIVIILKSLTELELIQKLDGLYTETGEMVKGYKVQSGIELSLENKKLPDRHLLLKLLSEDKFIVCDFGDIPKYNLDKCLKYFKVNKQMCKIYTEAIFNLLSGINRWLDVTGLEFVIDPKMFKPGGQTHHMVSDIQN